MNFDLEHKGLPKEQKEFLDKELKALYKIREIVPKVIKEMEYDYDKGVNISGRYLTQLNKIKEELK